MDAEHAPTRAQPDARQILADLDALVAPALLARKHDGDVARAWVPICGAGETAYAVAGALYAVFQQRAAPPSIQIFATDADDAAITFARQGRYSDTLAATIPLAGLRSFSHPTRYFQIAPPVRALLTFAQHRILYDPPFANLDLIVFGGQWAAFSPIEQAQLVEMFHWSLRPSGYLMLEAPDKGGLLELFAPCLGAAGAFQRRPGPATYPRLSRGRTLAYQPPAAESAQMANTLLQALNHDLRRKVGEQAQANNDLANLISATDLATIFLDPALMITRFTPQAQELFHLLPSDLGRPLAHIASRLEYPGLIDDAARVFASLQGCEREAPSADGRWYLARLRPYRTLDERIGGVVLVCVDITARRLAEAEIVRARDTLELSVQKRTQELSEANMRLQAEVAERTRLEHERAELLRTLVMAQEDERRRIARELHDQLGQSLSALGMGLGMLAATLDAAQRQVVVRLQQITAQIDQDMRRLATELRPTLLDDMGLVEALQYYVERWAHDASVQADFQAVGLEAVRLSRELESVVYRVIQEALTNVRKHANASTISVVLERRRDLLNVIVEDDGRGFDLKALERGSDVQRRLGLLGMRERVSLVGGALTIETAPGMGATLFAALPIPSHAAEQAEDD